MLMVGNCSYYLWMCLRKWRRIARCSMSSRRWGNDRGEYGLKHKDPINITARHNCTASMISACWSWLLASWLKQFTVHHNFDNGLLFSSQQFSHRSQCGSFGTVIMGVKTKNALLVYSVCKCDTHMHVVRACTSVGLPSNIQRHKIQHKEYKIFGLVNSKYYCNRAPLLFKMVSYTVCI